MTQDIVRKNLLPTGGASVTYRGISYRGLFYTCELAVREQWFVKVRMEGRWKVQIAYDPRRLDIIYLCQNGGNQMEVCHLLPISGTFATSDWHSAMDYLAIHELEKQAADTRKIKAKGTTVCSNHDMQR